MHPFFFGSPFFWIARDGDVLAVSVTVPPCLKSTKGAANVLLKEKILLFQQILGFIQPVKP
ncbi:MAG: hypothetical protein AAB338_00110 [Patescibacteria group bacterium]